jgi:hypothetical protein
MMTLHQIQKEVCTICSGPVFVCTDVHQDIPHMESLINLLMIIDTHKHIFYQYSADELFLNRSV